MVTFLIILAILAIIAIVIGIAALIILIAGGTVGGVLIFLFGDLLIGIWLTCMLIKKIIKRR